MIKNKLKKKFLIFSANRSEFFILYNIISKLAEKKYSFELVCSREVYDIILQLEDNKINNFILKNIIKIKLNFYELEKYRQIIDSFRNQVPKINDYNYIIVYGDRIETYFFSKYCFYNNKKLIHLGGGEITSGSMDNKYRYAISSISDYHFVTNKNSKKILKNFNQNVFDIGYFLPKNKNCIIKKNRDLFEKLNKPYFLITYHSNTLADFSTNKYEINELLKSLNNFKHNFYFVFTYPNPDKFNVIIIKKINLFIKENNKNSFFVHTLGIDYPYFMKNAYLLLGNTSSGIHESPYYGIPTINIGDRQKGRSISRNILNCKNESSEITFKLNEIINNYKRYNIKTKIKIASFKKFQKNLDKIITYE